MQRILFARVEVWLVGLLAILGTVGVVLFGALVLEGQRSEGRLRSLGQTALMLAEVPRNLQQLLQGENRMVASLGHDLQGSGWTTDPAAAAGLDGYLLLSRYDGDLSRHVVELRSLPDGEVRFTWKPDANTLFDGLERRWSPHLVEYSNLDTRHFRTLHPDVLENGDLLFKSHSPLFRVTPCGEEVWRQDDYVYHHSTMPDGQGGFWIPAYVDPTEIEHAGPNFYDDALARVDADGHVTYFRSLIQIMIDHGYFPMLFGAGAYIPDPLHLNDIEPVLEDGPFWRAGDLFLSLRHQSMIVLYRPSTDEIIWAKQGPWMAQHDVDVVDDHTIAVFSNDTYNMGRGEYIQGMSDIVFYDFATGTVSTPYHDAMESHRVRTLTEGLFELLPSGHVLVEQENAGRILVMTSEGDLAAEFVNRAGDGQVYALGWSRFVDRARGDSLLRQIGDLECDPS